MKNALRAIVFLIALFFVAFALFGVWLLGESGGDGKPYALDMKAVRQLAQAPVEERPTELRMEMVGASDILRFAVLGGSFDFSPHVMVRTAYQLVFLDSTIVIDAGMTEEQHRLFQQDAPFFTPAFDRVNQAMAAADQIIITHEHLDHAGGLIASPDFAALAPRLKLTPAQIHTLVHDEQFPGQNLPRAKADLLTPLDYDGMARLAPGVVLIDASGHTPGTQLVYVHMADGREVLFLGDVAWHMDNVRQGITRPRLAADYVIAEDPEAVKGQIVALKALLVTDPDVLQIASHDTDQHGVLVNDGVLIKGFKLP